MCSNASQSNASRILFPPEDVRGMREFNKDAFTKVILFPALFVENSLVKTVKKLLNGQFVRLMNLLPVLDNPQTFLKAPGDCKCLLLNPDLVPTYDSISEPVRSEFKNLGVSDKNFIHIEKTINFDNWKQDQLIESVLPEGLRFSGYTLIGHIAHFNLRTELLEYKNVLGMIVLNKIKNVKTVVNKLDIIDNTFRNFSMEIICGSNDLITTVKENDCIFELDFSNVYWNSRLGTEHERITGMVSDGDVFYDVFAGVGPFAVPAAKKGCYVLANDLNPDSVKWLKKNVKNNKINRNFKVFNKDAKEFILVDLKKDLLQIQDYFGNKYFKVHIVMNLPSMAVTFLDYFKGLFTSEEYKDVPKDITVYLYCFVKEETRDRAISNNSAKELVLSHIGKNAEKCILDIFEVRHVSVNKDMYRITIKLGPEVLVKPVLKRTAELDSDSDYTATGKHKQLCE